MYSDCGLMDTDFMTGLLCSCQNTARQFGAGGDFDPFRSYLNSVTMPTKRQCDYIHTIMCSQETITKSGIKCCISVLAHGGGGGALTCAWTPVKCLLIRIHSKSTKSTNPLHNCTVALLEAHHNSHIQLIVARVNQFVHFHIVTKYTV